MTTATRLTAEQQAALDTRDTSVALDAGAGCGKTFVLTERFLSHLDPGDADSPPAELGELIAITFTDAAAREMRDRIRRACLDRLKRASGDDGDYWLAMLRSIESARVQTIHSFCGSLVRAHAVELGLDPLFRVLDASASQVLRSEAIDAVIREQIDSRDAAVMRLASDLDLPGLKRCVAGLLDASASPESAAWRELPPAEAVEAWRIAYLDVYLPAAARRIATSPAAASVLEGLPLATPSKPAFADARGQLLERLPTLGADTVTHVDLLEVRSLAIVQGRTKAADWPDKAAFESYKNACKKLRELIDKVKPLADEAECLAAAEIGRGLLQLAAAVNGAYRQTKLDAGTLDYDDLLHEARRLLTAPEFADAQRRVQSRTRLLVVDEFQDTDRTQVEIVKAVVGPGFDEGRLFFVGDFKQSIYRFRGAEPGVFRRLQDETPEAGRLPLAMNFRSQPAVIKFVNTLFAPVFGESYQPLRAARPQVTPAPAVEFLWTPVAETASRPAARGAEARGVAARLRSLLDAGALIVGEEPSGGVGSSRPVRAGDIAILFRALSDVQLYEQALRDEGINYYLVGGHAFYSQQEVYDVANLLTTLSSGCDEVALAGTLRSPFFALHDETLYWLAKSSDGLASGFAGSRAPSELAADEAAKLAFARRTIAALRQMKGRESVAAVLVEAVRRTSFDAVLLSEFLGERKLANLNKLIDQARAFDAFRPGDLDGFVRQLTEFIAREPKEALAATRSGAADEVRLMTVHAAKGLEFPVVVLADLDRPTRGETSPVAFDAELGPLVHAPRRDTKTVDGLGIYRELEKEEDRAELDRLFYVACTRAADYLILSAPHAEGSKPAGHWLTTLDDHFDLATGHFQQNRASDPELLVTVTRTVSTQGQSQHGESGPDRRKLLEQAVADAGGGGLPASARRLDLDASQVRRFSVSKLTGQLHYGSTRPATKSVDAALRPPDAEVDARGLGTLTHALLERMDFGGENPGLKQLARSLAPLHVRRNVDEAASEAFGLLDRFGRSDRFRLLGKAAAVEREVEFLLPWRDGAYLQGYIDCLTQGAAGDWTVLDYKTNRVAAEVVRDEAEKYRLQLYVYALAVEQARGITPGELCIHFLRPGVEVTFTWDDEARAATERLVDEAIAGVRQEAVEAYRRDGEV